MARFPFIINIVILFILHIYGIYMHDVTIIDGRLIVLTKGTFITVLYYFTFIILIAMQTVWIV